MGIFAVIENKTVVNTIVADSKEIAEDVTQKECLEIMEENMLAIGATWNEEYSKYVNPCEYPSHIYNGTEWVPPIPIPEPIPGKYFIWDEESLSFITHDEVVSE